MGFFKNLFGSSNDNNQNDENNEHIHDEVNDDLYSEEYDMDNYDEYYDNDVDEDSNTTSDNIQTIEVDVPLIDGVEDFLEQEEDAVCDGSGSTYFSVKENEGFLFACNLELQTVYFGFINSEIKEMLDNNKVVVGRVVKMISNDGRYAKALLQIISEEKPEEDIEETDNADNNGDIRVHYAMWYWMEEEMDSRTKTMMDGRITLNVTGIRFRDDYEELLDSLYEGETLILRPEPTNPYDHNALAFYTEDDTLVGYLSKKDQPFARFFMAGGEINVEITSIDGEYVDTEFEPKEEMVVPSVMEEVNMHLERVSFTRSNGSTKKQSDQLTLDEFIKGFK